MDRVNRRTGRPPLADDDPSVSVHVRVPTTQYDELYTRAVHAHVTVPELIRRVLERAERRHAVNDDDEKE